MFSIFLQKKNKQNKYKKQFYTFFYSLREKVMIRMISFCGRTRKDQFTNRK